MGYSVHVDEVVTFIVRCGEMGCEKWAPPWTDVRDRAVRLADEHARAHAEAWGRLNAEWERTESRKAGLACPCCRGPVALVAAGLDAGLYRCDADGDGCHPHPPWSFRVVRTAGDPPQGLDVSSTQEGDVQWPS